VPLAPVLAAWRAGRAAGRFRDEHRFGAGQLEPALQPSHDGPAVVGRCGLHIERADAPHVLGEGLELASPDGVMGAVKTRHGFQEDLRRAVLDELAIAPIEYRVGRRSAHFDEHVRAVSGRHERNDRLVDAEMKLPWVPRDWQNRPAQHFCIGRL